MGFKTGNQYGKRDITAETQIQFRLTEELKATYKARAKEKDMKLTEWIISVLNKDISN